MSPLARAHIPIASVGFAAFALASSACHGCRGDHPYVPYAIDSAEASAPSAAEAPVSASAATTTADAGAFAEEASVAAPPGLARWPLQGLVLDAPEGDVFVFAVVRDFDGDGANDAFAIARPPEGNDPGQLVYYRGQPQQSLTAVLAPAATFPPRTVLRAMRAARPWIV